MIGLAVTVLAGCSATGDGTSPPAGAAAGAAVSGGANAADISFSQEMIPHHRQTLEIGRMVADRSSDAFIEEIVAEISAAESAEIETMSGWLREWSQPVPEDAVHGGHDMPGMLTVADVTALQAAPAEEFDRLWLETLTKHLRNGVAMAKEVQASGAHQPTKDLATQIITNQEATIAEIAARPAA
jgi:uncharacterized protein (DUF305 family)